MRKVLWDVVNSGKKLYKANLHCHSVYSDGKLTVEEIKKLYQEHGYSAVAFTDHDIYLTHNELTDENFVALNGSEYGICSVEYTSHVAKEHKDKRGSRLCTHLCLIAKDPANDITPVFKDDQRFWRWAEPYKHLVKFDSSLPDFNWEYSAESTNELIRRLKEAGFFVTYNHPNWSYEKYPVYSRLEGMDAIEVINGGTAILQGQPDNEQAWSDLIRQGKKVYGIATDDNHNGHEAGHPRCDSFTGYVKILAEKLSYENLIEGLEKGDFIAGSGDYYHDSPDILQVSFDDETREVHIVTTGAQSIFLREEGICKSTGGRNANFGETITESTFKVNKNCHAFRVVARSVKGFYTYSQCFYIDGWENLEKIPSYRERREIKDYENGKN